MGFEIFIFVFYDSNQFGFDFIAMFEFEVNFNCFAQRGV